MQENRLKHAEIKITGHVQGVFFRQSVKQKAEELGLTGWVKNEGDGSVKIVAEGEGVELQKFIDWCRKGTKRARVDKVEVEWEEAPGEFREFNIKY